MTLSRSATLSGSGPSDAALVVAARAGEAWASEALFRRHARMVNGLAFRLMGRDADVDDLVQDSFIQAFRSLHALNEPQAFASWLCSIVVRTASKVLRRRKLMSRLGLRRTSEPMELDTYVSAAAPPDEGALLRQIYALVETIPVEIRVPLLLRRVEGWSIEEIAEHTGKSLATVKRRLAKGEEMLERRLSDRRDGAP